MRKTANNTFDVTNLKKLSREQLSAIFLEELKSRFWAEKQLLDVLPKLSKTATSYELITAIELHEKVTQHQINRLLFIFDSLQERAVGSKYELMATLLEQAEDFNSHQAGFKRDSAIITACRNIMSHEIAIYEKLIFVANTLEEKAAADYLSMAISEERTARAHFSEIVLTTIYSEAG